MNERPAMNLPSAFYECETPDCDRQRVWPPHQLRWSPGGQRIGAAWEAGFYCEGCYRQHTDNDAWQAASTLAMELARGGCGAVGAWDGTVNSVRLSVVGKLVALNHGVTFSAVLAAPLAGDGGGGPTWDVVVGKEWGDTEFLPDDLVRVEGLILADWEGDPILECERVDMLREGFTGKEREELLACNDTEERWDRAGLGP